jgi:hypothetical protein
MVEFVRTATVADLLEMLGLAAGGTPAFGLNELVEDWYRLRKAGELSHADIPPARLAVYRDLCAKAPHIEGDGLSARFATLLRMMRAYIDRPPNRDFSLNMPDLAVKVL